MKNENTKKDRLQVQLIIRQSCRICRKVQYELIRFNSVYNNFNLQVFDLDHGDSPPAGRQPFITPAIWVNGVLWYLGKFDLDSFTKRIASVNGLPSSEIN